MFVFEIHSTPVPQKQTRFVKSTGHAYNPSKKDVEYIQWQIRPFAPKDPLTGAIELHLTFYLPIPKATSRLKRVKMMNGSIRPTVKPDFDNLAYLVTNSLKKIVYADDALVTDCIIRKRYSDRPRTVIGVIPLSQNELNEEPPCA